MEAKFKDFLSKPSGYILLMSLFFMFWGNSFDPRRIQFYIAIFAGVLTYFIKTLILKYLFKQK